MAMLLALMLLVYAPQERTLAESRLQDTGDTYTIRSWDVEDGLPVNTVNTIVQDEKGYLWLTTYDGIVRFDGLEFKVYNHANTPEMPQNRAVFMFKQEGTGIWITLENEGVLLIDENHNFTHFDEEDGFTTANSTFIKEDSKGQLWFATFDGLYKFSDGAFTRIIDRETPEQNRISYIYEDVDQSIWVATHDGLIRLHEGEKKIYNIAAGQPINEFRRIQRFGENELIVTALTGIYEVGEDGLFMPERFESFKEVAVPYLYVDKSIALISTNLGLYRYADDRVIELLEAHDEANTFYWQFYRDSNNTLWLLSTKGVLSQIKEGEYRQFSRTEIIPDLYYNEMWEDREGNMWLATARSGMMRFKKSDIRTIGVQEGLTGGNILGLFEDSRGRFWVGTRDYGLNMIDGKSITSYREAGIMHRDIVHSISEDHNGNIWVGYYQGGLDRINDEGIKAHDLGFAGGINDVRAVFVAEDSTIWLGTYGGLIDFDPNQEEHIKYTKTDGLAGNLIRYIDEAPDGSLWIGTADGGVSHMKDGQFKNYTTEEGLSSNNIRSVYVDRDDPETVWVGTENSGLNRIRNGNIESLGVDEGLPDHVVHYINEDEFGWLWMSSNKGVFKIDKEDLNRYLDGEETYFSLLHYGREEGMRNPECNGAFMQGGLKTSKGTFWFATQEGVSVFNIQSESENKVPPPVMIRNISSNGENYRPAEVELDPGNASFTVQYHALTFTTPEKTRFRYILEGYDEDWIEVSSRREITYSDLPSGDYTFKVLAANNDGVWSEAPATASIAIVPIFYEQPWFYFLLIGFIAVASYGVSKVRYRYLMKRQRILTKKIREQTSQIRSERNEVKKQNEIIESQAKKLRESNQSKDRFFSIIAHDLRSPFQAMVSYSDLLVEDFEELDREELKKSLKEIRDASGSLHTLVENLLSWASLQTGKIKRSASTFRLDHLVEENIRLIYNAARQKEITIHENIEDGLQITADENMIDTVVRNLISNAIKFTHTNGVVFVEVKYDADEHLSIIRIKDTGIGIPKQMVEHLLELHTTTSRPGTNNEQGSGLGLILCSEMIQMHSGTLDVYSEEGQGTTFTVTLPGGVQPD